MCSEQLSSEIFHPPSMVQVSGNHDVILQAGALDVARDAREDVPFRGGRAAAGRVRAREDHAVVPEVRDHGLPARHQRVEAEVELPPAEAAEGPLQILLRHGGRAHPPLRLQRRRAARELDALRRTARAGLQDPRFLGRRVHLAAPPREIRGVGELEAAQVGPAVQAAPGVAAEDRLEVAREGALVAGGRVVAAVVCLAFSYLMCMLLNMYRYFMYHVYVR